MAELLKVKDKWYHFKIWLLFNYSLFWKLSLVFYLEYLSQNLCVLESSWQADFKTVLGNQFDQDLKEKTGKTKCPFSYDFYCTPWVSGDHKVIWTWPGTRLDSIPSGGFCDSDVMHHRILSFLCKTTIFCDTKGSFESKKLSQCLTFIVKYHEIFL